MDEEQGCEHRSTHAEEAVTDYYDPNNPWGHGQYAEMVLVCDDCGEQLDTDPIEHLMEAHA